MTGCSYACRRDTLYNRSRGAYGREWRYGWWEIGRRWVCRERYRIGMNPPSRGRTVHRVRSLTSFSPPPFARVHTRIAIPVAGSSSNEKPVGEVGGNRVVVGGFHLHDDRQILRDGSTDTCNHADSLQHGTVRRKLPDRERYRSQIIQDTARWRGPLPRFIILRSIVGWQWTVTVFPSTPGSPPLSFPPLYHRLFPLPRPSFLIPILAIMVLDRVPW